jgi:hypothetical protein
MKIRSQILTQFYAYVVGFKAGANLIDAPKDCESV